MRLGKMKLRTANLKTKHTHNVKLGAEPKLRYKFLLAWCLRASTAASPLDVSGSPRLGTAQCNQEGELHVCIQHMVITL